MYNPKYSAAPTIVYGFHGTDGRCADDVISGRERHLTPSKNEYDWLGEGIYFWESNPERALQWAEDRKKQKPSVIGAIIDLGRCLNLLEAESLINLKLAYSEYERITKEQKRPLAKNSKKFNYLDCAVINTLCELAAEKYDTVRGVFWEGEELYPSALFKEKNHIQICVRNPKCILGYFNPFTENPQNKQQLPDFQ